MESTPIGRYTISLRADDPPLRDADLEQQAALVEEIDLELADSDCLYLVAVRDDEPPVLVLTSIRGPQGHHWTHSTRSSRRNQRLPSPVSHLPIEKPFNPIPLIARVVVSQFH